MLRLALTSQQLIIVPWDDVLIAATIIMMDDTSLFMFTLATFRGVIKTQNNSTSFKTSGRCIAQLA